MHCFINIELDYIVLNEVNEHYTKIKSKQLQQYDVCYLSILHSDYASQNDRR